jgi:hypothetical protein
MLPLNKNNFYGMNYEDKGGFDGDAVQQNNALANFITPTVPNFNVRPPIVERDPFNPNSGIITDSFDLTNLFKSGAEPAPTVPDVTPRAPGNQFVQEASQPAPTVSDIIPRAPGNQFIQEESQQDQPVTSVAAKPKDDNLDALVQQILGQGTTASWKGQGYGSAEANAREMAKILASAGVTNINQVGMIDVPYDTQVRPDGRGGFVDLQGKPVDPSKVTAQDVSGESGTETVYTAPITTSKLLGNKATGQRIVSPFSTSEQTSPNLFGGTYEGDGATGFHVQFDSRGNPIFYTGKIAQNPLGDLGGPVGSMIASAIGGPLAVAALGLASGKKPIDILKSAALSYAGGMAGNAVSGVEGITDVLGKTGTDIASNVARSVVGSGFKVDPVDALLSGVVNTGINSAATSLGMGDLNPAQQRMLNAGINAAITNQPIDRALMSLAMAGAGSLSSGGAQTGKQPPEYNIDELLTSIQPKTQDTTTDESPSNQEILNAIGYEEPKTTPTESSSNTTNTVDDTDWASLYNTGLSDEEIAKREALLTEIPAQEMQITPKNLESYDKNLTDIMTNKGGLTSQWQKSGSDQIMIDDDGTGIGINTETGETYSLDPDQVNTMIKNGQLNTKNSGYVDATGGTGGLPGGTAKAPVETTAPKTPAKTSIATSPATPTTSSGIDLLSLLALLAAGQQPQQQQAPMQDPYAHIKLMQDLFGSKIDVNSNR